MDSPFSPAFVSLAIPSTTILAIAFATFLWYRVSLVKVQDDEEGTSESLLEAGTGANATVAAKVADIQDGFKTKYTVDVDGRPKAPGLFIALFSTISFIL